MKKLLVIILLMVVTSFTQQRPPDEVLSGFTNSLAVNNALIRAGAAVTGTGVSNQLVYWTGGATVGALSTAIYPSLTELSYTKGVTSGIQNQINSKQSTLVSGTNIKTINSQSVLGSGNVVVAPDTTGEWLRIYNIIKPFLVGESIIGTRATLDSMIIDFRKNNFLRLNK